MLRHCQLNLLDYSTFGNSDLVTVKNLQKAFGEENVKLHNIACHLNSTRTLSSGTSTISVPLDMKNDSNDWTLTSENNLESCHILVLNDDLMTAEIDDKTYHSCMYKASYDVTYMHTCVVVDVSNVKEL